MTIEAEKDENDEVGEMFGETFFFALSGSGEKKPLNRNNCIEE
jgi:hypothetical protein